MAGGSASDYADKLHDVFDSCDTDGVGLLTREQLLVLCSRLQLSDADYLVDNLLGDDLQGRVCFEDFKEGFVSVLSQTVEDFEGLEESSSFEDDDKLDDDISLPGLDADASSLTRLSPRGGISKSADNLSIGSPVFVESERSKHGRNRVNSFGSICSYEDSSNGEDDIHSWNSPRSSRQSDELFEAEGELDKPINTEEAHLRAIWRELGVGKNGYLTVKELSKVCQHIGMQDMDGDELISLFDRLDADNDKLVSFSEFSEGLFQHGISNLAALKANYKPHLPPRTDSEDHVPLSTVALGYGLFTEIDPDNTGYAQPLAIIDMWQKYGVGNGAEVLEHLSFDLECKVGLSDLGYALEQELHSVEKDNAVYHAAVVTHQRELKHCKSTNDNLTSECEKLHNNLNNANQRIDLLIKESDEMHKSLEKGKDEQIREIEDKFEKQIEGLQDKLSKQENDFEKDIEELKQQLNAELQENKDTENTVKQNIADKDGEIDRLKHDIDDLGQKCVNLEDQNQRLEAQLRQHEEEELERQNSTAIQEAAQNVKLQEADGEIEKLNAENKKLRDRCDELTSELEQTRQELQRTHKQLTHELSQDIETRPNSECSTDDAVSSSSKMRRQLPHLPSHQNSLSDDDQLSQNTSLDHDAMIHPPDGDHVDQGRIEELQRAFSEERCEIEDAFKFEISELEEQHNAMVELLQQKFISDQEDQVAKHQEELQEKLQEQELQLRKDFDSEKHDIMLKYETEKNMIQQKYAGEQVQLIERLKEEHDEELSNQLVKEQEGEKSVRDRDIQLEAQREAIILLEQELKQQEALMEQLEKSREEGETDEEKISLNKEISQLNKEVIEQDNVIAKLRGEVEMLKRDILNHKDQYDELELKVIKREKEYEEERTVVNEEILLQQDEEIQRQRSELVELKQQLLGQREHFSELEKQLIEREARSEKEKSRIRDKCWEEQGDAFNEQREEIIELKHKLLVESDNSKELNEEIVLLENRIKEERVIAKEAAHSLEKEYQSLLDKQKKEMHQIEEQLEMERELCDGLEKKVNDLKDQKGHHEMTSNEMEDVVNRREQEVHQLKNKLETQKSQYDELEQIQMRHEEAFQHQVNQRQDYEDSLERQRKQIDSLTEQLEMEREMVDGLEKQVKDLTQGKDKDSQQLRADLKKQQTEFEELENKLSKQQRQLNQEKYNNQELRDEELERQLDEIDLLQTQLVQQKRQCDDVETQLILQKQKFEDEKLLADRERDEELRRLKRREMGLKAELGEEQDRLHQLEQEKTELKQKIKHEDSYELQGEELSDAFERDKADLAKKYEQIKKQLEEKHRLQILDYENIFIRDGESGLHGKLKQDFYSIVEKHKEKLKEEQREALEREKSKVDEKKQEEVMQEKEHLAKSLSTEKRKLERTYNMQMDETNEQLHKEYGNKFKKLSAQLIAAKEEKEETQKHQEQQHERKLQQAVLRAMREAEERHEDLQREAMKKEKKLRRELELAEDRTNQQTEDIDKLHSTRKHLRAAVDDLEMRLQDEQIVRQAAVQQAADMEKAHRAQMEEFELKLRASGGDKDKFTALQKSHKIKIDNLVSQAEIDSVKLKSLEKQLAASEEKCKKMMDEIAALETYQMQVQDLKDTLSTSHQDKEHQIRNVEGRMEALRQKHQDEVEQMKRSANREREQLIQEKDVLYNELNKSIGKKIHSDLEEDFLSQMDTLKATFDEERRHLESRIKQLQQQLQELQTAQHDDIVKIDQLSSKLREQDRKYQYEIEELKHNKDMFEKKNVVNDQQRKQLQGRCEELEDESQKQLRQIKEQQRKQLQLQDQLEEEKQHHARVEQRMADEKKIQAELSEKLQEEQVRHGKLEDKLVAERQRHKQVEDQLGEQKGLQDELEKRLYDQLQKQATLEEELVPHRASREMLVKQTVPVDFADSPTHNEVDELKEVRNRLEQELEYTSDQLTNKSTDFALLQVEHDREVQELMDELNNKVNKEQYNELKKELHDKQREAEYLQKQLDDRMAHANKMVIGVHDNNKRNVESLEQEKRDVERKLKQTESLLEDQVNKLRDQYDSSAKRDYLLKDLYVENTQLIKTIEQTERREQLANKAVLRLEEKSDILHKLLIKICPIAMQ